ncbi:hypothetical protein FA95DRAFT_1558929 [Auriscalpium vulgare]|uniref:Uncharacterized protein n=1 Tax=Auriscalpium vulgare TaxID=40419 RepID=A0ACB8RTZ5_9AGAM|nr:hypothetical protein FA95DRAFT_1558929 [Auriscalpium vulgare]
MMKAFVSDPVSNPEFLEIDNTLRRNPAKVIQRAKDGSVLAVQAIALSCSDMRALQTRAVIDIFCSHVSASKIPRPFIESSPSALSALGCAFWSFTAMNELTDMPNASTGSKTRCSSQIAEAWDGIYHWTAFFDELFPQLTRKEQNSIHLLISQTVFIVTQHLPARPRVLQTPGIVELAASLWVKEPRYTSAPESIGQPTSLVVLVLKNADDAMLDRFVDAAGGLPARVARAALSHLHGVLKKEGPEGPLWPITPHLHVLRCLTSGESDTLRSEMLKQCGVSVVTQAIVALATRGSHELSDTRGPIELALELLALLIMTGDGVRWLCSALHEGLLRALAAVLQATKHYDAAQLQPMAYLLREVVPTYLVYKPVANALVKSLYDLDMDVASMRVKGSALKEAWLSLETRIKTQARLKDQWDADKRGYCDKVSSVKCRYNNGCRRCADRTDFKQCARCKDALYCSVVCQTADWNMHKTLCSIRTHLSLRANLPTKGTHLYLQRLALHDARQNVAVLRSEARKDYPGASLSEIGVTLYYDSPSPRQNVFLLNDYYVSEQIASTEEGIAEDRMASIVDVARTSTESVTLLECTTILGDKLISTLVLVYPSIWDARGELGDLEFRVVASEMAEMVRSDVDFDDFDV